MSVGMYIIKKDGTKEPFNVQKVVAAVNKSAERVLYTFKPDELDFICRFVTEKCEALGADGIMIAQMHNIVEGALDAINPAVAKSYRDYRNYKTDFVQMLDTVYKKSQSIMYIGDKENSNADSALVSTRRSLIFNQLNKQLYQKFFLTVEELQAQRDGYIYIHDMSARRDTMNCCLFDVGAVLRGGFEMGNLWYNEPKTLNVAFDVIGDIVLSAASQQYGGFTVSCVDQLLDKYAEASYIMFYDRYRSLGLSDERAQEEAMKDIVNDFEQGFQGWEYKFNTVASSRGDYPFITMTLGLGQTRMAKLASKLFLKVHAGGQGKKNNKKPVLFPKLVFLYDENLHGPGKPLEDVFEAGIECSSKTMYPDWLSLTGEGYVASMYKQYGAVISPMGCRAFLSPWFERGGMQQMAVLLRGQRSRQHRRGFAASAADSRQGAQGEPRFLRGAGLLPRTDPPPTHPHLHLSGRNARKHQPAGLLRGRLLRRPSGALRQDQAAAQNGDGLFRLHRAQRTSGAL